MPDAKHLKLPFFARPSAKRIIDELGQLERLTVFAGAGVTIDRTGFSWSDLVHHLLTSRDMMPHEEARTVIGALGPLRAASAAIELWFRKFGSSKWQVPVVSALRGPLYENVDWLGGQLSRSIAELWIEYLTNGRDISVLTTNYDEHIERELLRAAKFQAQVLQQRGGSLPEHVSALAEAFNGVMHLHGRIPENENVPETDYPVISERDYARKSSDVRDQMIEHFSDRNVLMLGSSLTDPPLLDALLNTRSATDKGYKRWATVPRAHIGAADDSETSVAIMRSYDYRLAHFKVEPIYVDHLSQIAQLLAEVLIASTLAPGEYPGSDKRHGERLRRWWEGWFRKVKTPQKFAEAQSDHHRLLVDTVEEIRQSLNGADELLRIDVWLRWRPSNETRQFRLWASSVAQYQDWELARVSVIDPKADYIAVRAFSEGRVLYHSEESDRWKTFIALPLAPLGEASLVVGSIVIASMREPRDSCLGKANRGNHAEALLIATNAAARIAATDDDSASQLGRQ